MFCMTEDEFESLDFEFIWWDSTNAKTFVWPFLVEPVFLVWTETSPNTVKTRFRQAIIEY